LELEKGEVLYLASDGYIDQNGSNKKRLGTLSFVERLESIQNYSLEKQQEILLERLQDYQKDTPQRDDITILGVKI
jgi:serine phosphatase RsbU (regulator of sigma subunit)